MSENSGKTWPEPVHAHKPTEKKLTQSLYYNCCNVRQATDDKSSLLLVLYKIVSVNSGMLSVEERIYLKNVLKYAT